MQDPTNIYVDLIFIILNFFVFLFNYGIAGKKIYQPAVLLSLIWFIILTLHFFFRFTLLDELYPLSIEVYVIFFIGVVAFSIGAFIVNILNNDKIPTALVKPIEIHFSLRIAFMAIVVIGLPFYIQAAFKLFLASEAENFMEGLRYELVYGDVDIGPTKYFVSFSFVVFAINLYAYVTNKNSLNRWVFILSFIVSMTYAFFATGRTFFFMILTLYIGINFLQNKNFSIKKYLLPVVLFIPLFMAFGVISGRGGNLNNSTKENVKSATEDIAIYMVSPLSAFNLETKNFREPTFDGNSTLRFFVKIGQQVGMFSDKKVSELIPGFVFVPYPTNVYTYYSPYRKDYGIAYAFFMLFIFGILHTWLCNKAIQARTFRFTLYYSFLLFPLLMSFFQDQYLSLFSTWVQIVVFVEIALFLNKLLLLRSDKKPFVN